MSIRSIVQVVSSALLLAALPVSGATPVYRCVVNDVTIFSDQPCDAAAQRYEPEAALNTSDAPARTPARAVRTEPQRSKIRIEPQKLRKQAEMCASLTQSLAEIRSKMRAGYRAKEGEKLREREAKLKQQARREKCG